MVSTCWAGTNVCNDEAFWNYGFSAENGHAKAQCSVGHCHEIGIGTVVNKNKAFRHYLLSADMGSAEGQWQVGNCFMM